jgi:hypothetical protein
MVLSGGYARNNYEVVAKSLANLLRSFQLRGEDDLPQRLRPLPGSGSE